MPLQGTVILLTGATDGLGRQVAIDLAKQGASLLVHGRSPQRGRALLQEVEGVREGAEATYYNADLSSLTETASMESRIRAEHKRLDVLINNAGVGVGTPGEGRTESADGYELRFAVNVLAPFLLTNLLLPLLIPSCNQTMRNVWG
jgi:NAD(P)-dependent dehydrogenase (short-subunit alcohol dehydrogenase family)